MQGADLLLKERGTSISQIALLCGFDSPSHFSKMFRQFIEMLLILVSDGRIAYSKNVNTL